MSHRILIFSATASLLSGLLLLSCSSPIPSPRLSIPLAGEWQFALDTGRVGESEQWFLKDLTDVVSLPGTTDSNQKGFRNSDTTTLHLSRKYRYEGAAWYRREITIPENFAGRHLQLTLERTKSTAIWIDGTWIGGSSIIQAPQIFDVSELLTPGTHFITIRVDNALKLTPYGNTHIYSDDTQTNWNGILGKITLEASAKTHIRQMRIFPDTENQKADVRLILQNQTGAQQVDITLHVKQLLNGQTTLLKPITSSVTYSDTIWLSFPIGEQTLLWDEYQQPLYELTAVIAGEGFEDALTEPFGMRTFTTKGTQFQINGRTTFLRGKHEAAVFPLTGHAPMTVDAWIRVYRIAKTYGINHYRFHSYCPPEAAFAAADQEGIYLQVELPFWGGLDADSVAQMLRAEGLAMLDAYANHPSFVMMGHGNEIWSGHDRVEANILAFRAHDPRPLYTLGANNNIGYVAPRPSSDFYVGARTPYTHDTVLTHTRLTHAFADSRDGGLLNTTAPNTLQNFGYAVSQIPMPTISHEIGQYQIYPHYREMDKYTGNLEPRNLMVFAERLKQKGMAEMDSLFQQASGAWAARCYRAEMEAALRTQGLAGFQLLDLQDFPGQGTALVGVLDAFMDSKGVIAPEVWRQSCNDVTVLLEFPRCIWVAGEHFTAQVKVANYSAQEFQQRVGWKVTDLSGNLIHSGTLNPGILKAGALQEAGQINIPLQIDRAQKLLVTCQLEGTPYQNTYEIWAYPPFGEIPATDVQIARKLDESVLTNLEKRQKVLLFPSKTDMEDRSFEGLFPPDFWNYGMFKGISAWAKKPVSPGTLGLLMDPNHPLFTNFPTDFHTNWQWYAIVKNSRSFILDSTPANYRPIVQVIDNLERNHKLGLIFEFQVGEGRLLVCTADLQQLTDNPPATQLYRSMLEYMNSPAFQPGQKLTAYELKALFAQK